MQKIKEPWMRPRNVLIEHIVKLEKREAVLRDLVQKEVPPEDDELTYNEAAGWHCAWCDLIAPDQDDLASFEHHEDCWLLRARAALEEGKR